jgi:hypothetical protein
MGLVVGPRFGPRRTATDNYLPDAVDR